MAAELYSVARDKRPLPPLDCGLPRSPPASRGLQATDPTEGSPMIRPLSLVLCTTFALALNACKGGGAELVKAQEKFAEDACACKDLECVKKVQAEQQKWVAEHGAAATGSEEDAEKIAAANKKLTDCVTKLATASAGK